MLNNIRRYFGPSTLIAAAFIGPGTITVCTLSGNIHGYSLLWALLFSIVATILLQEMSLRLGIVSGHGLGEAIQNYLPKGVVKIFFSLLVFSAIIIGNAAYEAGNISGAVLGLEVFTPNYLWPVLIGLIAFALLYIGEYKYIERVLIFLVVMMSICFLVTAIALKPSLSSILQGFLPSKSGSVDFKTVMAIIGTTVVPYNLFLHASIISHKYKSTENLPQAKMENIISIVLGGIISMLIMIVAATALFQKGITINNATDMAAQLEPLLGRNAKFLFGIGLFAAGLSSAVTAPMAAAYAAQGIFGWKADTQDIKFRMVWIFILIIGVLFSLTGIKFISIIQFAQVANGLLLPIIACYLIYLCNHNSLMKQYANTFTANIASLIVVAVCLLLSIKTFMNIFG